VQVAIIFIKSMFYALVTTIPLISAVSSPSVASGMSCRMVPALWRDRRRRIPGNQFARRRETEFLSVLVPGPPRTANQLDMAAVRQDAVEDR